jgi:hypothetical protein
MRYYLTDLIKYNATNVNKKKSSFYCGGGGNYLLYYVQILEYDQLKDKS